MARRTMIPLPAGLAYASEVTTDRGTFEVGESVWVAGWPKAKGATYRIHRVLWRDGFPIPDVQVSREHRGTRQIHSVRLDRLGKRRDKR